jgi:hypothetical protein
LREDDLHFRTVSTGVDGFQVLFSSRQYRQRAIKI